MSTDLEIFKAEMQRARDLGLDVNKLDLDAVSATATGMTDIYKVRGYSQSMIEDRSDVEQYLDDDNLYLHFNIPKTGDREVDLNRLQNSLSSTRHFAVPPSYSVPQSYSVPSSYGTPKSYSRPSKYTKPEDYK